MEQHKCEWGPEDKNGYQACRCGAIMKKGKPDANGVAWDEHYSADYMKLFRAPMDTKDLHKEQ